MSRPRIALGLESSSVSLNRPVAARIGEQLAHARAHAALNVGTIADRLLLSRSQVRALEVADTSVFYNVKFQAAALRKYADLLGVQVDAIDDVLIEPEVPERGTPRPVEGLLPRPGIRVAVAAVMVVAVGALMLLVG